LEAVVMESCKLCACVTKALQLVRASGAYSSASVAESSVGARQGAKISASV